MSELKIYFAAPIRGDDVNREHYLSLIENLKSQGTVLTELLWLEEDAKEQLSDTEIFQRDLQWILSSDIVIAEVSSASLGVGFEAGIAWCAGKPFIGLYKTDSPRLLSAMIRGNTAFKIIEYTEFQEVVNALKSIEVHLIELLEIQYESIENELETLLNSFEKAINAHDIVEMKPFFNAHSSAVFVSNRVCGVEEIQEEFQSIWQLMSDKIYSTDHLQWVSIGPIQTICTFDFQWEDTEEILSGKGSIFFSRTSGSWVISHMHIGEYDMY